MAEKNLGKVGITTEGQYSSSLSYSRLTMVSYEGESWISKTDVPIGISPTEANSQYWQKAAARGAQGPQGEQGEVGPQGNSGYTGAADELEVVNNLTQGGETSALSAEQGKVIGSEVFGGYTSLLEGLEVVSNMAYLSDLSLYNYGGTSCNRYNPINVVDYRGQTIRIKAFVPSGKQIASGFVDANNRSILQLAFDTNEYQEFTIPDTAKELRLCFSWNYQSVAADVKSKSLSEKITDLAESIAQPFIPLMPLNGMKWKAVGDSITAGTNGGVSYTDKVASLLSIICENAGQPGATLGSMTSNYLNKTTDAAIVTVMGGTNDFNINMPIGTLDDTGTDTIYGVLRNLLSIHRSINPNVPIVFLTPCHRYDRETNEIGNTLDEYVDAIINFCTKNNLLVVDLYNTGLIPNSNSCIGDKVHLNDSGATELAAYIAKMLPYFVMVNRQWK